MVNHTFKLSIPKKSDTSCSFFSLRSFVFFRQNDRRTFFFIMVLLLLRKISTQKTDSYSLRSFVFLDRMTEEHFFLLDIRLAMPVAYRSERKTGWLRPAVVRTLEPSVPTLCSYNIKLCRRCNAPKTLFVAKELRP